MSAETLTEACECDEGSLTPTNDQMKRLLLQWLCDNAEIAGGGGGGATEVVFESLGSLSPFDATTLTGSFQNFAAVVPEDAYSTTFYNNSNEAILISSDGTNDGPYIPAGGSYRVDAVIPAGGHQFSVKHAGAVPASGNVRVFYSVKA